MATTQRERKQATGLLAVVSASPWSRFCFRLLFYAVAFLGLGVRPRKVTQVVEEGDGEGNDKSFSVPPVFKILNLLSRLTKYVVTQPCTVLQVEVVYSRISV